jgi:phosphoribosyl 1,2-cyclic phosphodiesterase
MRIHVLASGSEGNAALFVSRGTQLLVDAGVGPRVLAKMMAALGLEPRLDAIVITHAHADHVGHSVKLARKWHAPLFASEATSRAMGPLSTSIEQHVFCAREPFVVGALSIAPLPIPHDAAQVALRIDDGQACCGLATDLGEVTGALESHVADVDVLLLESNHDEDMLACGPYPPFLKKRIAGASGHLSNVQSHALLRRLGARTHAVALMHLSRTNNLPEIAREVAEDALSARPDVTLHVAPPRGPLVLEATPREGWAPARAAAQMPLFAGPP